MNFIANCATLRFHKINVFFMLEDTEKCPTPKNKGNGFELV